VLVTRHLPAQRLKRGGGHRHLRWLAVGLVKDAVPRDRAPGKHSHIDRQDTQRSTGGAFLTRSKTGPCCRKYLENKMKNAVQYGIAIPLKQSFAPVIFLPSSLARFRC